MSPKAKHADGQADMQMQLAFDPMKEIQGKLKQVETADVDNTDAPLAHADFFTQEIQMGLNKCISVHMNGAYIYDAFAAYFDRDNVGMPGTSCFFKVLALSERNDSYLYMDHLNKRGGRVMLAPISPPPTEPEGKSSSTLNAFEITLALAKDRFQRLRLLAVEVEKQHDQDTIFFLQHRLCDEANKIRKFSHKVAMLRKMGDNEAGLAMFDQNLVRDGQDQALAAAVEAIVPCKLYEGTIRRERKRQSNAMEAGFFAENGSHRTAMLRACE